MVTFRRANMPENFIFKYNNKVYSFDGTNTKTDKSICIEVLSSRLKGKTDLHGQPYKPSKFYFNPI